LFALTDRASHLVGLGAVLVVLAGR